MRSALTPGDKEDRKSSDDKMKANWTVNETVCKASYLIK